MNLFTYGTLRLPEVMTGVTGTGFPAEPAVLPGYACLRLLGKTYPGIIARRGEEAEGVLYRSVDPESMARLDRFEDDLYLKESVRVRVASGETEEAFAYVVPPESAHLLEDTPWDLEAFAARDLEEFLESIERRLRRTP